MAFAIKAEVGEPWAETFAFTAQKTMYGGKRIAKATRCSCSRASTRAGPASSRAAWSRPPQRSRSRPASPGRRRAGRRRLVLEPPRWDVLDRCRLDPARPLAAGYRRLSAERVSRTDPDATLMRTAGGGRAVLGYQTHYVVDGGRARIILHALTTPGDVRESQPLLDLLRRVRPNTAVGDSKFGTVENIVAQEDEGIRAYFPLADTEHRKGPYYPLAAFSYDAERDEYRCPQGQPLRRDRVAWAKEFVG
jgi:Transposase DDE domain